MSTMTPLIGPAARYPASFGKRQRAYTLNAVTSEPLPGSECYARQFMTAFAGGLVFFAVMIF